MAIVRIELYAGRTRDQKAAAAEAITEAMSKTLGTTSAGTQIIFVDVNKSDWAHDSKLQDGGSQRSPARKALLLLAFLAGITSFCPSNPAAAQDFPNAPVRIVVPFAAGGPADVIGRIFAERMATDLGQPVIIENITGAGGTIGTTRVAQANPDGYMMVMSGNSTHSAALAFYDDLKYDPVKDFASVGLMSTNAVVVIGNKNFPPNSLQELIAHLRTNGAKVNNGHGGIGSVSYSACVIFNSLTGASPTMIAYRGVGPATTDLLAGVVDYVCDQVPNAMARITENTVKGYVVSSTARQSVIPDVPTGVEAGLPKYKVDVWYGLSLPKGTPPAIVARLNRALRYAQDEPTLRKRIYELGGEIPPPEQRAPKELDDTIQTDLKVWVPLLIEAKKNEKK